MTNEIPQIPGFVISNMLGVGSTSVVYRAQKDGQYFALKIFETLNQNSSQEDILRFLKEASALAKLSHPGLLKIHEVSEFDGRPYLVMDLVEGQSLAQKISSGPLTESQILTLAKELAEILNAVHSRGLIHRDLKPENILFDFNSKIKIIDFGFATEVGVSPSSQNSDLAAGTILYSAPEQTGILKRLVDSRSDLYALGGLLYHCTTGSPPFHAATASEILAKHLSEIPKNPSDLNPLIRPVVSAIILKLLAKDPDDRYQSAKGLLLDIENIIEIEKDGAPFQLGQRDVGLRILEMPLVGREEECAIIERACQLIHSSKGSILIVEGEGGSGKSRLVRELLTLPINRDGLVLSAKAQQGEKIPFGPLRAAIDSLLARANRSSEQEKLKIIEGIKIAAGDFAPIVRRLSPGLRKLFSEQQDLTPLQGNAEQERFYLKIADFFLSLAQHFGPTILLLDDVQWLDDGSIEVLKQLSMRLDPVPLLLATTARNDADSKESLDAFKIAIQATEQNSIVLKPLHALAVKKLITAHLGGKPLEDSATERITAKANGNPFAVGEYLRALLDSGALKPTATDWVFDSLHFRDLQLPDDVIQLLINRIANLNSQSAEILSVAAVIGYEFELDLLIPASGSNRDAVNRALEEGFQGALIEKTEVGYSFVHDRVSEALTQAIPLEKLKNIHEKIARTLEEKIADSPGYLYAVARHYFLGNPEKYPLKVYQTSLNAGINAIENFSNEEALELLERALHVALSIDHSIDDFSRIYELIGLACTRTGRQQKAIENFRIVLTRMTSSFDRARLHYLLGLAYASEGRYDLAKPELIIALDLLKAKAPKTKIGIIFSILFHWFGAQFRILTRFGFGKAKGDERERRRMISRISSTMNILAYFLGDPLLMAQSIIRELHNVQYLGTCVETAKAHVFYAVLLGYSTSLRGAEKHGKLAIAMAQQLGDREAITWCEYYYATSVELAGDVIRGHQLSLAVYPKVVRYCSAWEVSNLIGHRTQLVVEGKAKESAAWAESTIPEMKRTGDLSTIGVHYSTYYSSLHMLGKTQEALQVLQIQKPILDSITQSPFLRTFYNTNFIHGCLMQEEFGAEVEASIQELDAIGLDIYHSRYRYFLIGYVRLEQLLRAQDPKEKEFYRKKLSACLGDAGFPKVLTAVHLCHCYALKGAWHSVNLRFRTAKYYLAKAEKLAYESDNLWAHWVIARERARIAAKKGDHRIKDAEANRALRLAIDNSWLPLVRQICREFNLTPPNQTHDGRLIETSQNNYGRLLTAERNAEVLLQISLASASTLDPVQQSRAILDELVKVLGAERAFLFEENSSDGSKLMMRAGRDNQKNDIKELKGYSTTVVQKVRTERQALVVSGTDEGEVLGSQSVVLHNLRSILAAPLMFRTKFIGVIYLDSTLAKGIFTEQDLSIVTALGNHIAIAIETARSAKIEIENLSLKKDLEVTSAVQSLILPKNNSVISDSLEMSAFYKSASQSGGDWWWYDFSEDKKTFSVLMGDVTGHGAGPAMISAAISSSYHTFKTMREPDHRLPDFLKILNNTLFKLADGKYLLSMGAFEIDLQTGEVEYWSAGAPPIYIMTADQKPKAHYGMGTWLGLEKFQLGRKSFKLIPGDRIAIFTDGLYEIDVAGGRQFGLRQMGGLFEQSRNQKVKEASDTIIDKINSLKVISENDDDISLLILDFLKFFENGANE